MSENQTKKKMTRGMRCPICGEELSSFDTKHMKAKHPEYFQESRKLRYGLYVCVAVMGILGILMVTFNNGHLALSNSGNIFLIAFGINFIIILAIFGKLMGLMRKYRDNPIDFPT